MTQMETLQSEVEAKLHAGTSAAFVEAVRLLQDAPVNASVTDPSGKLARKFGHAWAVTGSSFAHDNFQMACWLSGFDTRLTA